MLKLVWDDALLKMVLKLLKIAPSHDMVLLHQLGIRSAAGHAQESETDRSKLVELVALLGLLWYLYYSRPQY